MILGIDFKLSEVKDGVPDVRAKKHLDYYYQWHLSQKIAFYLGLVLDKNFAFIGQDKVKAKYWLKHLRGKDKSVDPPFLFRIANLDRQAYMTNQVATDKKYQQTVKKYMLPLSEDRILKLREPQFQTKPEFIDNFIAQLRPSIDKIKSRGGRVILVQLPLTGNLKMMFDNLLPRQNFWNRLINESNANLLIHYEDYTSLNSFNCPDSAHLTINDSKLFTQNFLAILSNSKNN